METIINELTNSNRHDVCVSDSTAVEAAKLLYAAAYDDSQAEYTDALTSFDQHLEYVRQYVDTATSEDFGRLSKVLRECDSTDLVIKAVAQIGASKSEALK